MPTPRGTLLAHTRELVDAIMAGWRAGHTYGRMGKEHHLEKNVVAGIVYRNKEPGELSARSGRPPRSDLGSAPKRLPHHSGGHMPTGRTVVHTAKMASGARFRACQWIQGEKGVDFKLYAQAPRCRAPVRIGSSYCNFHFRLCHIRASKKTPEAA